MIGARKRAQRLRRLMAWLVVAGIALVVSAAYAVLVVLMRCG